MKQNLKIRFHSDCKSEFYKLMGIRDKKNKSTELLLLRVKWFQTTSDQVVWEWRQWTLTSLKSLVFRPQQTTTFFRTLIVAEALHLKHLSQCNIAPFLSKSAVCAKPPRLLRFSHLIRYVYKTKQLLVFFYFGSLCGLVIIRNTA